VLGPGGSPAVLSDRGVLSVPPVRFRVDDDGRPVPGWPVGWQPVQAWAGPWPVDERWWTDDAPGQLARFQVVGVDGSAWLLLVGGGRWWVEASYD
jgi:protein ImuB